MSYYYKYNSYSFKNNDYNSNNVLPLDKELLIDLLTIQAPSTEEDLMQTFVCKWIKNNVPTASVFMDRMGNIYATKGDSDIFPCVVAHMDEVNDFVTDRQIIQINNILIGLNGDTGEPAGCPGDDRVGCYVALEMLRVLPNIKVAFFVQEEIGGIGSEASYLDFFKDCAFIAQADRMFNKKFIIETNGLSVSSEEFQTRVMDLLIPYNYEFGRGTFTDVGVLASRGVGISVFNIECGYYDSHSYSEKVCLPDVENCMNIIYSICIKMSDKRWIHKAEPYYVPPVAKYNKSKYYKGGGSMVNSSIQYNNKKIERINEEEYEVYDPSKPEINDKLLAQIDADFPIIDTFDPNTLPCSKCRDFDCQNCDYSK